MSSPNATQPSSTVAARSESIDVSTVEEIGKQKTEESDTVVDYKKMGRGYVRYCFLSSKDEVKLDGFMEKLKSINEEVEFDVPNQPIY
ncbi:hypothetical protein CTI12_AA599800 [Artemisia annua]|uniref:Uncharacterized protein n=1 Tax=Artemisia annua TaxID=35608 RepID=A0A2U1KI97_ARTAN|nr:hypothetical protein CTI12_AA599800 [Artemisia annua]